MVTRCVMETLILRKREFEGAGGKGVGSAEYMLLLSQGVTAAASHLISQPSGPKGGLFKAESETHLKFHPDG